MLDVTNSLENLATTVHRHFLHIRNQHPFMRAWAVQFEIAYTDFRVVQMALQLDGEKNHELLRDFSFTYEDIYKYEYSFAAGGLEGFNAEFSGDDQMKRYEQLVNHFEDVTNTVRGLQPAPTASAPSSAPHEGDNK